MADRKKCPAPKCAVMIRGNLLACRPHWYSLSKPVRDAIWATVGLPTLHPDRRQALEAALEEWRRD
jgi:hypothetical protein